MGTIAEVVSALRRVEDLLPVVQLAHAFEAAQESHLLLAQVAEGSSQSDLYELAEWFETVCGEIHNLTYFGRMS